MKRSFIFIAISLLLLTSCASVIINQGNIFNKNEFSSSEWKKYKDDWTQNNQRGLMINSLKSILSTKKPNYEETIILLGEGEDKKTVIEYEIEYKVIVYSIGWWSGYKIDPDTFDVYYTHDGEYIKSLVHQH